MDDESIVDLFLKKDESAISHVAEKYGSRLRAIAFRITEDSSTADECENDTYLEAWNRIPPAEPRAYLPAFLFRIVRNISLNRCAERDCLKRKAYLTELSEELEQCLPSACTVESEADGKELAGLVSRFLCEQSREKRTVFMRRYFYLDTVASLSRQYGCSESRMKTLLFRMRNDLRRYLSKEGYTV